MRRSAFLTAIQSMNFQEDRRSEVTQISVEEWPRLLDRMDRAQITLPFGTLCRDFLPVDVVRRIDRNLADNTQRHDRLFEEYHLVAHTLEACSIPFVVLKGLSHDAPLYTSSLRQRPQSDIDLYTPPQFVNRAYDALVDAGFKPVGPRNARTDHLPPMIRQRDWSWRGNYYAADLPLTVELHFRLWDMESERIHFDCEKEYWDRRTKLLIRELEIPALSLEDRLSYAAMHLVRHLLRGDLRLYHVYELAHFLQHTQEKDALWERWRHNKEGGYLLVEAIAFRLAAAWFGCAVHPIVRKTIETIPSSIDRWFRLFALSPLATRPNKDELILHLSLLKNRKDRYHVLWRRLIPSHPGRLTPSELDNRLRSAFAQARFVVRRTYYHTRAIFNFMQSLVRWKALRNGISSSLP